jgi:hypothetical protein
MVHHRHLPFSAIHKNIFFSSACSASAKFARLQKKSTTPQETHRFAFGAGLGFGCKWLVIIRVFLLDFPLTLRRGERFVIVAACLFLLDLLALCFGSLPHTKKSARIVRRTLCIRTVVHDTILTWSVFEFLDLSANARLEPLSSCALDASRGELNFNRNHPASCCFFASMSEIPTKGTSSSSSSSFFTSGFFFADPYKPRIQ